MALKNKAMRLLRRLSRTTWAEFRFRGTQEIVNRWDGLLYRLGRQGSIGGNTKHSRQAEAAPRFFFTGAELPMLVEILQLRFPEAAREIIARADRVCAHRFDLLGYKNLDLGRQIDWHLDPVHDKRAPRVVWYDVPYLDFDVAGDVKITWELNRHQHFVTLGKAYQLTSDEKYAREFISQFWDWQAQNPYPVGVNWASSLEVAFRSLSWLWARELFAGSSSLTEEHRRDLLAALERNAKFIERNLSYYFSPNTHLLGEGAALFFIGMLCPELKSARRWRERGWKIVLDEAKRQVRTDGGYFEQSTYYHVYALDFLLHARILAARNEITIPPEFDRTVLAMLEYLAALGTAGEPPRFGDDDGGRLFDPVRNRGSHLFDPLSTGAALFRRADFKNVAGGLREETLWLLGPASAGDFDRLQKLAPPATSCAFPATGTYILASDGLRLVLDAGPLGSARGGHGHADALSVCAAADGSDWLSDPGTFTYTGSRQGREQFRGTRAHNTMVVDELDQAVPIEPFAWGRFPESTVQRWLTGQTFDLLEASHDGYARLASPVRHRRFVYFVRDRFWFVVDAAEGYGHHAIEILWHGPAAGFELDELHRALTMSERGGFAIVAAQNPVWSIELADAWWSPNYGAKESRPALRCHAETNLPAEFATLLVPRVASRADLGVLEPRLGSRSDVRGYEYVTASERHLWVMAASSDVWQLGEFSSDAQVVYCARNSSGNIENLVLCDGSFFSVGGEKFLNADRRCEKLEYRRVNGREEVFPTDAARIMRRVSSERIELAAATADALDLRDKT
jgi:Heparinase II/III-like protein/Heparinase II/III N-terminus